MFPFRHLRSPKAGIALAFFAAFGCVAAPSAPDTTGEISDATGIDGAVEFRWSGGPLDEDREIGSSLELRKRSAIECALRFDPRLQAALARVRIALAESERARVWPNPILSIVLRFPEGGGALDVEAGLAAEFIDILRRPARSRAADHRLSRASADAVTTALEIVAEADESYSEVQALDAVMPLLEERLALVSRLADLARVRVAAGEGSRPDLTALESRQLEVEIDVADKRRERLESRLRLLRIVGRPSDDAEFPLEPWMAPDIVELEESDWIRFALDRRPEVRVREAEISALEEEAALAGLSWLAGSTVGIDAERDGEWSAGPAAAVPIPLFDTGGPERARLAAAMAEQSHEITLVRRGIVEEVRRALEAHRASIAALGRVRNELIPSQERRRSEMESLFRAGESDVTHLLIAEQDLQAARVRAIELELDSSVSRTRLTRAVGGYFETPGSGEMP